MSISKLISVSIKIFIFSAHIELYSNDIVDPLEISQGADIGRILGLFFSGAEVFLLFFVAKLRGGITIC